MDIHNYMYRNNHAYKAKISLIKAGVNCCPQILVVDLPEVNTNVQVFTNPIHERSIR